MSSVAIPHLLHLRIHPCCPAYLPPCSSAAVFTADIVCHLHFTGSTIRPQVGSRYLSIFAQSVAVLTTHFSISVVPHLICCRPTSTPLPYPYLLSCISSTVIVHRCLHRWYCLPSLPPVSLLQSLSNYLPLFRIIHRCCLSTLSGRIFSSLCNVLYYTAWYALLHTNFLTLRSDILTTLFFSILERLFSISVMFSLCSDLLRFFFTCLHSGLLQSYYSPQLCLLWSAFSISDMLNSDCFDHALIFLLRSVWIRLLRYSLSFVLLDLLISLQITHDYVAHHLLLAYTIT